MALVFGVIAASILVSSMFRVSSRTSTNTGTPPRSTNAFAVDTKVNEGMMTSSPGWISISIAAISSAAVQLWVRSALGQPTARSSQAWHRLVNGPSPERCWFRCASLMYSSSRPVRKGRLKGIRISAGRLLMSTSSPAADRDAGDDQRHAQDLLPGHRLPEKQRAQQEHQHEGQADEGVGVAQLELADRQHPAQRSRESGGEGADHHGLD